MIARHYKDLVCWQLATDVKKKVYAITARQTVAKDFQFARFLETARASLAETHNHANDGVDLGFIDANECATLCRLVDRAGKTTVRLIRYLERPWPKPLNFQNPQNPQTPE
jgi:hypothetical protein